MKYLTKIWSYLKKISLAITVMGGIVGVTIWFYSQVIVRIDKQENTTLEILEKIKTIDNKINHIQDEISGISQGIITNDELLKTLTVRDIRIKSQIDLVVTQKDQPADKIITMLNYMRNTWDKENEIKKNPDHND